MSSDQSTSNRFLPVALAAMLCCGTATAAISDTIHPFVALGYTYDDNLLRLPENFPVEQRSDRATQAQAGILFDRPIGRQRLTGRAKVSRVTFDHFDELDYNGKDFGADLAWQLGNRWSGNAGGAYVETLTPFSDFHVSERNLRRQRTKYLNGAYRFHAYWQVRGAFVRNQFDYELPAQRINNRTEDVSEAGFDYLARSGSKIGLVARHLKGSYDNERVFAGTRFSNDYSQDELKVSVNWLLSSITQVQVLAGYAKRKHAEFYGGETSGANGRITATWAPFDRLRFNGSAWREFAAVESSVVTSSFNKGVSAGATWDVAAKVQATATVRRENREFEQSPGIVFTGDPRDRLHGATLGLTWLPRSAVQVGVTAFRDSRSGSPLVGSSDYRAKGASLNVSVQF